MAPELFLASTSVYRTALLQKLAVPFTQIDPVYEEKPIDGESPVEKALRLARGKAEAALTKLPTNTPVNALILASDQVAHLGDSVFSKPGTREKAFQQLTRCSGQWVCFSTAVCLLQADGKLMRHFCEPYRLKFRPLSAERIDEYLDLDQPYDCAGSIKAEAHGILLIEDTEGQDINTLYGLPLIQLASIFLESK